MALVWCTNCGQRWQSLSKPHKPNCIFCAGEDTVQPVIPDKLVEKVKKVKAEAEARADAKAREVHERTVYQRAAEADQAEQLAARDNPADAVARRALEGKADGEEEEDDPMSPAAPPPPPPPPAADPDADDEPDELPAKGSLDTQRPLPPGIVQVRQLQARARPVVAAQASGGQMQVLEAPQQVPQGDAAPLPPINPTSLALEGLKRGSPKIGGIMEWLEEHSEWVEWGKQAFVQTFGVLERHSQRQAELQKEQLALQREMMERGLLPGARQGQQGATVIVQNGQPQAPPAAPALPDFASLPLADRVEWAKRGGIKAYYAQQPAPIAPAPYAQQAPPNQYVQSFIPAPTPQVAYAPQQPQPQAYAPPPPPPNPLADASGRALDMTKKQGIEGLREARRAMGLPELVGAPGAFRDKDFRGSAIPPAPAAPPPPPPPAPTMPDEAPGTTANANVGGEGVGLLAPPGAPAPDNYVEGEEEMPPELRALPKQEKHDLLVANNAIKQATADRIVDGIALIPPEHVADLVRNDTMLLNEKLRKVLYLLPKEQRDLPVLKGLMDTQLRDLIPFIQGPTRDLYKQMRPDALVAFICAELPDHRHLHDPKTKAWLVKNLKSLRDSMA